MILSVAYLGCCKNISLISGHYDMRGRQLEGLSCLHKEEKKIYHFSMLVFEQTFWKIPWGTVYIMFCIKEGVLSGMQFQIWTEDVNGLMPAWIWNQNAGLIRLACRCGRLTCGPKLLSLCQAVLHHISLTMGLWILLQKVLQLLEKIVLIFWLAANWRTYFNWL